MKPTRLLFLVALICLSPAHVFGQGSVEGQVTDREGRALPNAEVTLKRRGIQTRQVTDSGGSFRFFALSAGEYELVADASGYYPAEAEIVVRPRQPVTLQIELAVRAQVKEQLEVRAADIRMGESSSARLLTHSELEALPAPVKRDIPTLSLYTFPGATLSHDNFVHVRGNEVSLQEFINGVSFLENPQQQFSPGLSPEMFETVEMISGSFPAEFGNRFGGVLDITTRSGQDLRGHGSVTVGAGTFKTNDLAAEYGGVAGKFGYYFFGSGFTSDWYLNPPEPKQLHDFGFGLRGGGQFDYQASRDRVSLFVAGGGTNFELPNLAQDQQAGRDAERRLRSQTAILNWQRIFSPRALFSTSVYQRTLEDRLKPTSDPVTSLGDGSRSSLTAGLKSDLVYARGRHTWKAGFDLTRFRLRERFRFDGREIPTAPEDPAPFTFQEKVLGGQASLYLQDHVAVTPNLAVDLGLRWDHFDLINTYVQMSPRFAAAYHIPASRTSVHLAYNRFFSPHPLEYVLLANHFGTAAPDPGDRIGPVKPYRQHYFEVGIAQEVRPKLLFELNGFYHRGDTPFEYREISSTRLFLPINSDRGRSYGAEMSLELKELERLGLSARLQYAYQRTFFFGPLSGGFRVGEDIAPGQRFLPAFDEPHSGTATLLFRRKWRGLLGGLTARYGSGTAAEDGRVRLPSHGTLDLTAGANLWQREGGFLRFELNLRNVTDSRYNIAKESTETPIQFAWPRIFSGHLKYRF